MENQKRMQELVEKVELLNNKIAQFEVRLLKLEAGKTKGRKSVPEHSGSTVWEKYREAFYGRYHHAPVRNAKVNSQCAQIASRLGAEAGAVITFYLSLNDQQFTRLNHPVGIFLMNCESIYSMWQRGKMTTAGEARNLERRGSSMDASRSFLEKKHGKTES